MKITLALLEGLSAWGTLVSAGPIGYGPGYSHRLQLIVWSLPNCLCCCVTWPYYLKCHYLSKLAAAYGMYG